MSGTFDRRPELMILIAVLVAAVLGLFALVGGCTLLIATDVGGSSRPAPSTIYDELDLDDLIDRYGNGEYDELEDLLNSIYGDENAEELTEADVPEVMDIEVPELSDDLQVMINRDITLSMGLDESQQIEITELTKDSVGTPALKNGYVLCQVSGKATVKNAEGKTDTIDYTSYYYADDPRAASIVWYIYAYDLGSYDLFPDGFKLKAGDPMGYRSLLLGDEGVEGDGDLLRDRGRDATNA